MTLSKTTMKLYVPEGSFLVCDKGMTSRELIVTHQSTVFIKDHIKLAGTELDKMQDNHNCAKMVIAGAIIGVAIAAVVCAAVVLTGGTLAIGLGSALAIGAASGAGAGFLAGFIPCICACLTDDYWIKTHPTVCYQGLKPLLEDSELPCWMGGTVRIVYSKEMADALDNAKRLETFLTVAAITFAAFTLGKGLSSFSTMLSSLRHIAMEYGKKALIQHGINTGVRFGASWGAGYLYDEGKKGIDINGYTLQEHIDGTATGTKNEAFNQVMTGLGKVTKYPNLISGSSNAAGGISVYSVSETTTTSIMTSPNIIVTPDGTALPPNTPSLSQNTTTNYDTRSQNASTIFSRSTHRDAPQSHTTTSTRADGSRVITNTTTTVEHGSSYTSPIHTTPKSTFADIGKNEGKSLLNSLVKDITLLTANYVTSWMKKGIEEAKAAEEKARQGVKVHETTV